MVVEGHRRRLAVECDGERWHTPDQLQRDLQRQAILERLGWIFVRIRGSVFFRDPDVAMAPVFAKLQQLDIEPLGSTSAPGTEYGSDFVNIIRNEAHIIRLNWEREKSVSNETTGA
jgi:hypothetical protein